MVFLYYYYGGLKLTHVRAHMDRWCAYDIMLFLAYTCSCAIFAYGMVAALLVAYGSARAYVLR